MISKQEQIAEQRQKLLDKINKGSWDKDKALDLGDLISTSFDKAVQSNPNVTLAEILKDSFGIEDQNILAGTKALIDQVKKDGKYQAKRDAEIWELELQARSNSILRFLDWLGVASAKTEKETKIEPLHAEVQKKQDTLLALKDPLKGIFTTQEEAGKRLLKRQDHYITQDIKYASQNNSQNLVGITKKQYIEGKSQSREKKEHFAKKSGKNINLPVYSPIEVLASEMSNLLLDHLSKLSGKVEYRLVTDEKGQVITNEIISKKAAWNNNEKNHDDLITVYDIWDDKSKFDYSFYFQLCSIWFCRLTMADPDGHLNNILYNERTRELIPIDFTSVLSQEMFSHNEIEFRNKDGTHIKHRNNTYKSFLYNIVEQIAEYDDEQNTLAKIAYHKALEDFKENFHNVKPHLIIHLTSILDVYERQGLNLKGYVPDEILNAKPEEQANWMVEQMAKNLANIEKKFFQTRSAKKELELSHADKALLEKEHKKFQQNFGLENKNQKALS